MAVAVPIPQDKRYPTHFVSVSSSDSPVLLGSGPVEKSGILAGRKRDLQGSKVSLFANGADERSTHGKMQASQPAKKTKMSDLRYNVTVKDMP